MLAPVTLGLLSLLIFSSSFPYFFLERYTGIAHRSACGSPRDSTPTTSRGETLRNIYRLNDEVFWSGWWVFLAGLLARWPNRFLFQFSRVILPLSTRDTPRDSKCITFPFSSRRKACRLCRLRHSFVCAGRCWLRGYLHGGG